MVADAGTHTGEEVTERRVMGVLLAIGGMLFVALLVGLIGESIERRVNQLKKGHSLVLERNHTLILGWTQKLLPTLRQLILANESEGGGIIVIMAEKDKEEMDQILVEEILDTKGTRLVTRSGNPIDVTNMQRCSVHHAKTVLVLSPDEMDADEADAATIRATLAAASQRPQGHIVVEMCDVDNLAILYVAMNETNVRVVPVVAHDAIGRVMIQCSRQPGLAQIFEHILAFSQNEFYFKEWPQLIGMTFLQASFMFTDAVPIGIRRDDRHEMANPVILNPPDDFVIEKDDRLIVLAEDNDAYTVGSSHYYEAVCSAGPDYEEPEKPPELILFCGWRRDIDDMIKELDQWVPKGTRLLAMSTVPVERRNQLLAEGGLNMEKDIKNLTLEHHVGNPILRRDFDKVPLGDISTALVLSDETWKGEGMGLDSRSMVTMLLIRDIQLRMGKEPGTLISEIMDPRTKSLVTMASCSDYVVGAELISMVLASICENPDMQYIVATLFTEEGPDLHIRRAAHYVHPGETMSFWRVMYRARLKGHLAFGYRRGNAAFVLNPSNKSELITWTDSDVIAVISED